MRQNDSGGHFKRAYRVVFRYKEGMSKTLEPIDLTQLPPDTRAAVEVEITARIKAEAQARDLQRAADEHEDIVTRLEHLIKELYHALYGKKSEKLAPDDRQLCFEDLEVAVAEVEEQQAHPKDDAPRKKARKPKRNLGNLPKELPRIETVIEPDSILCPCGCGEMVRIGEDRTERLDIVPAQLRVLVTIRPKYACPACKGGVTQAKTPPHLIEGALPTEGAIAHVLVSKYADHCVS